jgi:hypothetical protein
MRYSRAVLLLPFAILLVSCGPSSSQQQRLSKSEYRDQLMQINTRYNPPANRLFGKVVVEDPATGQALEGRTCSDTVSKFAGILHQIVDNIAALRPPKEVEALQNQFVKEARASVSIVDQAARDTKAGRLSCGNAMNRRIFGLPSTERASKAAEKVWASLGVHFTGD